MRWKRLVFLTGFYSLCGMLLISGYAQSAILSVTCNVSVVGDTKTYTYTIVNNGNPDLQTNDFSLWMPEAGAKAVTSFTSSDPSWEADNGGIGDNSYWSIGGDNLPFGRSVQLYLTTPASVPTTYTFKIPNWGPLVTNWGYTSVGDRTASVYGDTILPVPSGLVPEPSSILTLLCGMGGVAGTVLKRRR